MRKRPSAQTDLFEGQTAQVDAGQTSGGRSIPADVTPEVLRWARESVGIELATVARRFPRIDAWETGVQRPSVTQLETLSELYKRPLVTFFLPSPPAEPPLPTDFRTLPSQHARKLSKKTLIAIRTARRVQRLYAQLAGQLNDRTAGGLPRLVSTDDPEVQAGRVRRLLGIASDSQRAWKDPYTAWREWRMAVEALGVLVLQLTIPLKEVRGFSFVDGPVPTITVSSSDAVVARMFTLFHELGHLLLATGGVCLPDAVSLSQASEVEPFCNRFSGAVLLPLDVVRQDATLQASDRVGSDRDLEPLITEIAQRYKVSRWVVLLRMVAASLVTQQRAQQFTERWSKAVTSERSGGPVPPAAQVLSHYGTRFVSMVLEAHSRNLLTTSDVADYLSLRVRHLAAVRRLLVERRG